MVRSLHKLFVSNLPWTVSTPHLKTYVQQFGRVVGANVSFDRKTGISQRFGFLMVPDETLLNLEKKERHFLEGNNIYFKKSEPNV